MPEEHGAEPGPPRPSLSRLRTSISRMRRERFAKLVQSRARMSARDWEEFSRPTDSGTPSLSVLGDLLVAQGRLPRPELEEVFRELDGDPTPRTGLERYRADEKVGEGAVAEVFRGTDLQLGRPVAIKILKEGLHTHPIARERFLREAQALARLDHPNVVRVYDSGDTGERLYLVMELVQGKPISLLLEGGATPSDAPRLLEEAARGVHHAHERGVVHRDLKPANILVTDEGKAKVVDFGLAHLVDAPTSLTHSGTVLGTPLYMSPEQVQGGAEAITPRSDVYALGAILYEAVAGQPPHDGTIAELYAKIGRDDPMAPRRLKPAIPRDLEVIALKALEKDPTRRYVSAEAFAEDLRRFLRGEPIEARPVPWGVRGWRRVAARPSISATIGVTLALTLLLFANLVRSWVRSEHQSKALQLLESARHPLEKGYQALYQTEADFGEALRGVTAARPTIDHAISLAPDLPLGQLLLGEFWELEGDYGQAAGCWARATTLDPRFGPAHYRLGRVLLWQAYLASLYLWPDERESSEAQAQEFATQAMRAIEAAQAQGSGFDNEVQRLFAQAMLAYLKGDRASARRACGEGVERFIRKEGVEEFHWLSGLVGETEDDRIRSFDRAISVRPVFPLAYYGRGQAKSRIADWSGALADFTCAIRMRPEFMEAYLYRGDVRFITMDGAGAVADYDRLIAAGRFLPAAYNGRGRAMLELLGDARGALPDLGEAMRLTPASQNILPLLARARAKLLVGDATGAVADATQALTTHDWADGFLIRGKARLALGDTNGAIADLDEALKRTGPQWRYRKELEEAVLLARGHGSRK